MKIQKILFIFFLLFCINFNLLQNTIAISAELRINLTDEFLEWVAQQRNMSIEEICKDYNFNPDRMNRDMQKFLQQYKR
ncbi:MAG: hypothetical protein ISN64_00265 [Rickettsia sp.]|nr:hypothetical protein [Rickettsia sp.]